MEDQDQASEVYQDDEDRSVDLDGLIEEVDDEQECCTHRRQLEAALLNLVKGKKDLQDKQDELQLANAAVETLKGQVRQLTDALSDRKNRRTSTKIEDSLAAQVTHLRRESKAFQINMQDVLEELTNVKMEKVGLALECTELKKLVETLLTEKEEKDQQQQQQDAPAVDTASAKKNLEDAERIKELEDKLRSLEEEVKALREAKENAVVASPKGTGTATTEEKRGDNDDDIDKKNEMDTVDMLKRLEARLKDLEKTQNRTQPKVRLLQQLKETEGVFPAASDLVIKKPSKKQVRDSIYINRKHVYSERVTHAAENEDDDITVNIKQNSGKFEPIAPSVKFGGAAPHNIGKKSHQAHRRVLDSICVHKKHISQHSDEKEEHAKTDNLVQLKSKRKKSVGKKKRVPKDSIFVHKKNGVNKAKIPEPGLSLDKAVPVLVPNNDGEMTKKKKNRKTVQIVTEPVVVRERDDMANPPLRAKDSIFLNKKHLKKKKRKHGRKGMIHENILEDEENDDDEEQKGSYEQEEEVPVKTLRAQDSIFIHRKHIEHEHELVAGATSIDAVECKIEFAQCPATISNQTGDVIMLTNDDRTHFKVVVKLHDRAHAFKVLITVEELKDLFSYADMSAPEVLLEIISRIQIINEKLIMLKSRRSRSNSLDDSSVSSFSLKKHKIRFQDDHSMKPPPKQEDLSAFDLAQHQAGCYLSFKLDAPVV